MGSDAIPVKSSSMTFTHNFVTRAIFLRPSTLHYVQHGASKLALRLWRLACENARGLGGRSRPGEPGFLVDQTTRCERLEWYRIGVRSKSWEVCPFLSSPPAFALGEGDPFLERDRPMEQALLVAAAVLHFAAAVIDALTRFR